MRSPFSVTGFSQQFLLQPIISLIAKKSCIDNILTNSLESILSSNVVSSDISHHQSMVLLTQLCESVVKTPPKNNNSNSYDYSENNLRLLSQSLEKLLVESNNDVNVNDFQSLTDLIKDNINENCKVNKSLSSKRTAMHNPWITQGIIKSIRHRDKLYRAWKKTITKICNCGDPRKHEEYRKYRNNLSHLIFSRKKLYYENQFNHQINNKKGTWKLINTLRGKNKANLPSSFNIDSKSITCKQTIATKFNNYFSSLAKNLNQNIEKFTTPNFESYLPPPINESIYFEDTNTAEILNIISGFSNSKASDIPLVAIKYCAPVIAPTISKLINKYIRTGVFPATLKVGTITPIHKKGPKNNICNYRPISILPIFGKIFEKVIYSRIYDFVIKNKILTESQFGFQQGHSTSHALHDSIDFIKKSHNKSKHVLALFIDLSKAFDTIDHKTLLCKLYNYGIRGLPFDLLNSYLTERYQRSRFDDQVSERELVIFGVPQGSVLGPLLFLLYINDIQNCNKDKSTKFVLYADDTNIFVVSETIEGCIDKVNEILVKLQKYMVSNLLHINLDKCCYMWFKYKNTKSCMCATNECPIALNQTTYCGNEPPIYIGSSIVKHETEVRYLGVILDPKLLWTAHIQFLTKKLKSSIATIKRVSPFIPKGCYKSLYHTLFESHLTYGISVWGNTSATNIDTLFRLQKRCLRILFGDYENFLDKFCTSARTRKFGSQILDAAFYSREHTKPIFSKNNILTVHNLYTYLTCTEFMKIIKYNTPKSLAKNITLSSRNNRNLVSLPKNKNRHFLYNASIIWNLSINRVSIPTIHEISPNVFKTKLKHFLITNQSNGNENIWSDQNTKYHLFTNTL